MRYTTSPIPKPERASKGMTMDGTALEEIYREGIYAACRLVVSDDLWEAAKGALDNNFPYPDHDGLRAVYEAGYRQSVADNH